MLKPTIVLTRRRRRWRPNSTSCTRLSPEIAADWPADRVSELLPRAWLAARQTEQQLPGQAAAVAVT